MPDRGLSVDDLARQASVGTLKRNPNGPAPEDPLDQGYRDVRKIAAAKLVSKEAKNLEAEEIDAENRRLKAEIEHQQLLQAAKPEEHPVQTDRWMQYMLERADRTESQLAESRREVAQAQTRLLEKQLEITSDELNRIRESLRDKPERQDDIETLSTQIDKAKSLIEKVGLLSSPAPEPGPVIDVSLEKWKMTLENEREQRRIEAEERRAERQFEMEKWREENSRAEARLDREAEIQNRFVAETLPKITTELMPLLRSFMAQQQPAAGVQAPAPGVAGQAIAAGTSTGPAPEQSVPPGFTRMPCQQCGWVITYRVGITQIICPNCGTLYGESPAAPETAAPSVPLGAFTSGLPARGQEAIHALPPVGAESESDEDEV